MRLNTKEQRLLMRTLPMRHKRFLHQYCHECTMQGQGLGDILKSIGRFGKKTIKFLTPAAKAIVKELKPILKEVGSVVLKEVVVPMINKKISGKGMSSVFIKGAGLSPAGGGLSPAGGGLKLAGQGKKPNPWMIHVKKIKNANTGLKFSEVLKLASKSYKK